MKFVLHSNFSKAVPITDLKLCKVLMNDVSDFPWLFLIPMRPNIKQIHNLSKSDQHLLMEEIDFCSKIMEQTFKPDQLNVAAIGNMTPQLHIHIIGRHKQDPYWPDVVWNKPARPMNPKDLDARKQKILEMIKP